MRSVTNLDFMRSVAVLLVASAHLLLYTGHVKLDGWSGITGVCIFFVHTSLVLMWSLERDPHVGRFYVRRAFRIYPLWIVVLLLTILVRLPMSPLYAPAFVFYQPHLKEFIANLLLVFNLSKGANVVGASWSLPLEVQMYLFLPFLFMMARATRLLWPLLLIDGFVMIYAYKTLPSFNSSLLMCAPYFIPGVMAFVLLKRTKLQRLPSWLFAPFLFSLIAIDHRFGNFRRSWAFCLILGLALPFFRDMTATPIRVISHYVARYSYGVYLSHIAAVCVAVHVLQTFSMTVRIAAFVVIFCVLPVVFYHVVEEPMIRLGARVAKKIERGEAPRVDETTLELEPAP